MIELLKNLVKVNDGDSTSWDDIKKKVVALTDRDRNMGLKIITLIMSKGFVDRLCRERDSMSTRIENKHWTSDQEFQVKKGTKRFCLENLVESSDKEDKDYLMIKKQKKDNTTTHNGMKLKLKLKLKQKIDNVIDSKLKQKQQNKKGRRKESNSEELTRLGLEPVPPPMPAAFTDRITQDLKGKDPKLVIQKFVETTDLTKQHNRFAMHQKQIRNVFLSEAEEEELDRSKEGIDVVFVEPNLGECKLKLAKWKIEANKTYILKNKWHPIVSRNADSLKPKAVVQVWSFRRQNSELKFAMIKVRDGEDGHIID